MKRISITLFAALLFIAATFKASAQTEQTRQVSGFNTIMSAGPFNVHIKMAGTESLKLSAPADIINDIETIVKNNHLEIKFKDEKEPKNHEGKIDVYVTAKTLSGLTLAGSGEIKVDGVLNNNDINMTTTGSGAIIAAVKCTDFHATVTGSGSINVEGNAENAKYVVTGSGEMKANGLKTVTVVATVTGSGNAHVNAEKTITAHVTGSGNLEYSGNATINSTRTAGPGRITRARD